ncbi:unnamed protein product, partial [Timema podura]|nr:unnamed protein product [Timema podura]
SSWKHLQSCLVLNTTIDAVTPEAVLNLLFFKRTTGCGSMCGCRKGGINCTAVCHHCHGDFLNSVSIVDEDEIEDQDEQSTVKDLISSLSCAEENSEIQVAPSDSVYDLKKLMDEADNGFIFFSLGSNIRSDMLSEEKRKVFLKAFSSLPCKVFWKWESDHLPGQPSNVEVRKWLPQNDILGHPNIRLFITHAGLLSTQEAIYHGVPILGVPFFADQYTNINKAKDQGFGEKVEFLTLTTEILLAKIQKILQNSSYKENAERISRLFKDQPETPLERAIFWTEYVLRNNGAHHLRSSSVDMPWYQYLLLDVIAVLEPVLAAGRASRSSQVEAWRRSPGTPKLRPVVAYRHMMSSEWLTSSGVAIAEGDGEPSRASLSDFSGVLSGVLSGVTDSGSYREYAMESGSNRGSTACGVPLFCSGGGDLTKLICSFRFFFPSDMRSMCCWVLPSSDCSPESGLPFLLYPFARECIGNKHDQNSKGASSSREHPRSLQTGGAPTTNLGRRLMGRPNPGSM